MAIVSNVTPLLTLLLMVLGSIVLWRKVRRG